MVVTLTQVVAEEGEGWQRQKLWLHFHG